MSTSNQQLSPEHYEIVLKYMQTTNQDDFDRAVQMLRAHQFILQNAVNTKFGLVENAHHTQEQSEQSRRTRSQEDIKKYIQYLRQKQNRSVIGSIFNFAKNLLIGLISGMTELILPEFILLKIMRTRFYVHYKQLIQPQIKDKKLSYLLRTSNLSRKPIMYAIAAPGTIHQCFVNLFNKVEIVRKIDESFIFSGGMSDEKQCDQIQGQKQPPTIVICRKNIFEKFQIVKKFIGAHVIQQIDVHKLNYALRDHQKANRRDKNLLVKYRNYVRRNYYGGRPGFYEQQQQQQLQLYGDNHFVVSDMIQKQNEDYKRVEQQNKRKSSMQLEQRQKMLEQQKKLQELQEQRKIRKLSIPQQPKQGQIIRINFRCPDGTTKTRNFDNAEKLDLIYHWVQTNEQIQFQDNNKRCFQLMHKFPPVSLASRREQLLKDIFESDQEKIMIRQL